MKKYKVVVISALSLSTAILLSACGNQNTASETSRNVQYSLSSDILTLDSSLAADATSINTLLNVESGLVRFDKNANVANDLAKSISISKDGLTYNVTLRSGLKWSNGDKLTAQDFVYGWQRTVDPKTASEYASALYPVKNAEAINLGKAPASSLGIKALDDTHLIITLATPTPYFEKLMTEQAFYPLNQKFVEKQGKAYGTTSDKTLYDGPYKFANGNKGWTGTNKTYSLVKNPNFYDAKEVKVPGVTYQIISNTTTAAELYKQGKLDLAVLDTPELVSSNKNTKGYKVLSSPRVDALEFNQSGKVPALSNLKIREAINLATNRQGLLDTAAPYYSINKTITPNGLDVAPNGEDFAKYAAQPYTYDATKAATLFKSGLKELGKSSLTLNLEGDSDDAFHKAAVDYLKQDLETALPGLTINEVLVPKAQRLKDAQNNNFQIIVSSWGADYNEPSDFLTSFVSSSPMNDGRFNNPAYDKAMKAASTLPDITQPDKLYADYKAAEKALYEEANVDPLDTHATPILMNPKLKGVSTINSGLIYDLRNASFAK
ncbi:peptide ABC transporter substrate-binding protein [Lactococcus protaetiae]|uniref:Peptide ABC transporter substrate-binding protein n=1 Tax=Lactococcus protaetiae TaxID=2592653 RepID=A0A514Z7W2_9LACT|nr:peptide ABC transporter substrate-binding protein [Lactococcus protaetiae]QDK70680.1 peptide ABC transporter substrate-binding protein [Lactococcus protaetiae]